MLDRLNEQYNQAERLAWEATTAAECAKWEAEMERIGARLANEYDARFPRR
jgi:hypothetical protein